MVERRYTEEETTAIFKAASELQQTTLSPGGQVTAPNRGDGMTLEQLQEIGKEVGIPSELVARAAHGLDRSGRPSVRRFLGFPIGVARTVALQRALTEPEWERLVVDLRETFDARGSLRTDGSFRQWTNGNLQALLEPTGSGYQLRLKTVKGDAYRRMSVGLAVVGVDAAIFALRSLAGHAHGAGGAIVVAAAGLVMFALGAIRVPGWARLRQKQMDDIAARLTESTEP